MDTPAPSREPSGGLDVLIVDDEPLARRAIRTLLAGESGVREVREAANATEAIRQIGERRPDVVFLDVQMPRVDGFGVIEAVGAERMPPVVFVTAHNEHALKAFDVHAVDYLLKPIDPDRFRDAFDRASRSAMQDDMSALRATLAAVVPLIRAAQSAASEGSRGAGAAEPPRGDQRLRVRHEGRIVLVDPREIDWLESVGNYVRLHLRGGTLRHRATMDEMQATLGTAFVRIRRSTLVRAAAVRYCEAEGNGSYRVVLNDQTRLTSSRYYRAALAALVDG